MTTKKSQQSTVTEAEGLAVVTLPPVDAVASAEPTVSYKLQFSRDTFVESRNKGENVIDTNESVIIGLPVDICLAVSKCQGDYADFNYRLRLAFYKPEGGELCELNLNAVSTSRQGEQYVTNTARSLLAGLMDAASNGDDLHQLAHGFRVEIRSGRKSMFLNLSIPEGKKMQRWVEMRGDFRSTPRTIAALEGAVEYLKEVFRGAGIASAGPAVVHYDDEPEAPAATTIDANAKAVS